MWYGVVGNGGPDSVSLCFGFRRSSLCPQNQVKSPFAAWVEAGPFTWFQDEEESLTPEDKLDALQRLLSQVSVGTGACGGGFVWEWVGGYHLV